jgi:tetratricopeptide (TPR) repeat protein
MRRRRQAPVDQCERIRELYAAYDDTAARELAEEYAVACRKAARRGGPEDRARLRDALLLRLEVERTTPDRGLRIWLHRRLVELEPSTDTRLGLATELATDAELGDLDEAHAILEDVLDGMRAPTSDAEAARLSRILMVLPRTDEALRLASRLADEDPQWEQLRRDARAAHAATLGSQAQWERALELADDSLEEVRVAWADSPSAELRSELALRLGERAEWLHGTGSYDEEATARRESLGHHTILFLASPVRFGTATIRAAHSALISRTALGEPREAVVADLSGLLPPGVMTFAVRMDEFLTRRSDPADALLVEAEKLRARADAAIDVSTRLQAYGELARVHGQLAERAREGHDVEFAVALARFAQLLSLDGQPRKAQAIVDEAVAQACRSATRPGGPEALATACASADDDATRELLARTTDALTADGRADIAARITELARELGAPDVS